MKGADFQKSFKDLIQSDSLAHGYIFYGPDLEAQWQAVVELANFLENNSWKIGLRELSDARLVNNNGKIGIDLVRGFSRFLYQTPNVSRYRLVAVKDASKLNHLAQNAMLKIAEEPPARSVLILTINDVGALSPILASRFQKIFFSDLEKLSILEAKLLENSSKEFLAMDKRDRKIMIKALIKDDEDGVLFDEFLRSLIKELAKESRKNWRVLKELNYRYEKMRQFNTNKRLQLEAALQYLK